MAQERSSELTTAYQTLIDATRRAEYDEGLRRTAAAPGAAFRAAAGARRAAAAQPAPPSPPRSVEDEDDRRDLRFESLRSGRDVVLRRVALERVDHLFHEAFAVSERAEIPGFDLSYLSRPGIFDRTRERPWLLAKFVPRLDKRTVQQVRAAAARANAAKKAAVSVFLLSGDVVGERDIRQAIETQPPATHPEHPVIIIPVDVRDWRALVPNGANPAIRSLAARLQER